MGRGRGGEREDREGGWGREGMWGERMGRGGRVEMR